MVQFNPLDDQFHCLLCGAPGDLCVELEDCQTVSCNSCKKSFSLVDVETRIEQYRCLLQILQAAKNARLEFSRQAFGCVDPVTTEAGHGR